MRFFLLLNVVEIGKVERSMWGAKAKKANSDVGLFLDSNNGNSNGENRNNGAIPRTILSLDHLPFLIF